MQLFGLKEDIGLSLAPSQVSAFGVYGLSADDGRLLQQPPVRILCQNFHTQGVIGPSTDAHDPSVGVRRRHLPSFAGEEGYFVIRRNAAERQRSQASAVTGAALPQ
jgi:hypothetical protein